MQHRRKRKLDQIENLKKELVTQEEKPVKPKKLFPILTEKTAKRRKKNQQMKI